jgi:hypothetical protein
LRIGVVLLSNSGRTAVPVALAIGISGLAFSQEQSQSADQHGFQFTTVADTTAEFSSFGEFPAINSRGEVAFIAVSKDGGSGVFRIGEPRVKMTTIASTEDGLKFFGGDFSMNQSGVVAFGATTVTGSRAIFTGDGASRTLIADSAVNGLAKIGVGSPSINAAGTVAFSSVLAQRGLPGAVFTGNGGPLTTIATTANTGFRAFGNVAINDPGTVVFPADLDDDSRGIFVFSGAPVTIVDTNNHPELDTFGDPVINNAGVIADVAFLLSSGAPQIITGTTRGITPRNDPANPTFQSTEHPSINNLGAVAFSAIQIFSGTDAPAGIFLEVSGDQALIPVVRPGDALFGSTVDHVNLGRFALNDRLQMAFSYTLTDGRSGVGIASPRGESRR